MGASGPNVKAIFEGKIAGKLAYDVIDRKPKITLDDPEAKSVRNLKGKIEFKNVSFSYPSRAG